MRHIVIQVESICLYPPTQSLLKMLKHMNDEVVLMSACVNNDVSAFCERENIKISNISVLYNPSDSVLLKFLKIPIIRYQIKKNLNAIYDEESIIWIMTSITLKYLGNATIGKRYIMYLYELAFDIRFYPKFAYPRLPLNNLLRGAVAVIECEYNRAHILKAWFNLKHTPYVLPNKPFLHRMQKMCYVHNQQYRLILDQLKNKKIILYQGIIDEERPLNELISAVDKLGDEYALLVMSKDYKKLEDVSSNNIYLMPFITPPEHLEVTSWAYMGVLTYSPIHNGTTSPLNAVYCAPNKLFEYAMFGIPMLGNNIPGLKYSVALNNMGVCFDEYNELSIIDAIKKIELNYDVYSSNALKYYDSVDNYQTLIDILSFSKAQN